MSIKNKLSALFSSLLTLGITQAQIPAELLHHPPTDLPNKELASIQGFQKTNTALQFIKASIYITYINNKATLSKSNEWDKVYVITPTTTEIRIISDTPNYFTHGHITFEAKAGQHYQVKNNQSDIKLNKEPILFWVENVDTGEMVTPKQVLNGSPSSTNISFIPLITSK